MFKLLAGLVFSCGFVASAAYGMALESTRQCQDKLPAPQINVHANIGMLPTFNVQTADAIGRSALGTNKAYHAFLGLTRASFQMSIRVHLQQVTLDATHLCASPAFDIQLSFHRLEIMTASELELDQCARDFVMNHELMHVLFHKEALSKAAEVLRGQLRKEFPATFRYAESHGDLRHRREELSVAIAWRARELFSRYNNQHGTIDNQAEYQRAHQVCNGVIPRLLKIDPAGEPVRYYPIR